MHTSEERAGGIQGSWLRAASKILQHVADTQLDEIAATAEICADAIESGGLVHLFGTGHSRIPVEEMFPRYGSYPGFNPIVELSMTFHTQVTGPFVRGAIVDQDFRLEFPHHSVQLIRLPGVLVVRPGSVVPQDIDLAVLGA